MKRAYVDRDGNEDKDVAGADTGSLAASRGGSLNEHFDLQNDHVHVVRGRVGRRQGLCIPVSVDTRCDVCLNLLRSLVGPWRSLLRLVRTSVRVAAVASVSRATRAPASATGTGAGAGMADARVPNARAAKVAIFMKENMTSGDEQSGRKGLKGCR